MSKLDGFTAGDLLPQSGANARQSFAEVTGVSAGGVQIKIDGEDNAGSKLYKRLASYAPVVGDRVLIQRISGTILIIGKVV